MIEIIIANILNLISGSCSIISTQGKNKRQIVFVEFISTSLRIIQAFLVKGWSDLISKSIKLFTQTLSLKNKLNKKGFILLAISYIAVCLVITYISKDLRCLVAIIPSVLEYYSLLEESTKKYRIFVVITKILWIINNFIFQLYVGVIFDTIVILGHLFRLKKKKI